MSYQTHCLSFSVSDYSGPWFCTRDGLKTKLPFHFFSNVGLLIEIDFQYYVVHNVLTCFFIYHFHRATDQAGKLGVGKNKKKISMYSNYQVTFLKCNLSRKCCEIFFSWFYLGNSNEQKSTDSKSDCQQDSKYRTTGQFGKWPLSSC